MAANSPIGVSFLPSEENQAEGQRRGALEGDLGQAFKILSLRMPKQPSIRGIAPQSLLQAPGASGMAGGPGSFNPQSAIFESMIRAMLGQGPAAAPGSPASVGGAPMPRIIPGRVGAERGPGGTIYPDGGNTPLAPPPAPGIREGGFSPTIGQAMPRPEEPTPAPAPSGGGFDRFRERLRRGY